MGERGAHTGSWGEGVGEAGLQRETQCSRERCGPARLPEREVRPQKAAYPILRNHFQNSTYLSASPGVRRTAPETSVRLCTPGWSRGLGERMISGKTPGSVLGKQRQTRQTKSGRLDVRKPTASCARPVIHLPKGHTQGFLATAWQSTYCGPQNSSSQDSLSRPAYDKFPSKSSLTKFSSDLYLDNAFLY